MFEVKEQAVELADEKQEIVELSELDLQWIGGGAGIGDLSY